MLYLMIQAVLFGVGLIAILATPLSQQAFTLIPLVTLATAALSVPLAWKLAPRVRAVG
ncbi:hypothetical protein GCM10007301_25560 [Azorhizobium oxalatiphilum]|uniref:Uncharacterized protein n=2 Tax=Azorhizobium oxalatiphilum TaxID=980631 RepID=A0A917C0U3_9HYPH|nr:hypothetical protein GCM10007301_25560 [Azorhizobium oxalatiphilum]